MEEFLMLDEEYNEGRAIEDMINIPRNNRVNIVINAYLNNSYPRMNYKSVGGNKNMLAKKLKKRLNKLLK